MGDTETARSYRVVQWATGNIGTKSLGEVLRHPHLELVGLVVHDAAKVGVDAGTLAGVDPVGVVALADTDLDAVLALDPDCVLYMPQACDADALCRLLAAGVDVVTTRGEFHHPGSMDPELRDRIEQSCQQGGSSIHSTGSSPGFITEALPIVLTSLQRRLDGLHVHEYADVSSRDSPDMLFRIMGFATPPERFDARRFTFGAAAFGPSLRLLGERFGLPLDSVEADGEVAAARHDMEIAAGFVPAGTVAAQRMRITGRRGDQPLLTFTANWYVGTDIDADWELLETGWRVVVEGDAPLDVRLRFPVAPDRMAATTPGYTANRAVNAVAVVCAAEPGIRTTAELPQVIAWLGDA
ncbi:MAG TPA: hypothetical protein VIY72_01075 [Acidimicrobiales bacterium]